VSLKEAFGRKILSGKNDDQLAKSLKDLESKGLGDKDMARLIRQVQRERQIAGYRRNRP
jgi:hypothetical protein